MDHMSQINLALLDHEVQYIRDQIFFLQLTCKSLQIELKVQNNVDKQMKNIIIEGDISGKFEDDRTYIRNNPSQFSMILTEHLHHSPDRGSFLNGIPVVSDFSPEVDPRVFPSTRFKALVENAYGIPLFLTCGELPAIGTYSSLFPDSSFAQLPWPAYSVNTTKPKRKGLVFPIPSPALMTPFRSEVLKEIAQQGCNVRVLHSKSIPESIKICTRYSAVLDVAKSSHWRYDSPMRSFISILAGRHRVNIRHSTITSPISEICNLTFLEYLSFSETELDVLTSRMSSRFETFVKAQDTQPLEVFLEWLYR